MRMMFNVHRTDRPTRHWHDISQCLALRDWGATPLPRPRRAMSRPRRHVRCHIPVVLPQFYLYIFYLFSPATLGARCMELNQNWPRART